MSPPCVTFLLFFRCFFVAFGSAPRLTFLLLFHYFEIFGLSGHVGPFAPHKSTLPQLRVERIGTGKRGHYERGRFAGRISRISRISKFSRISRKWSDYPLLSTFWLFSRNSRLSKFSRISRKWTFLKRPLFQKTPFSEPERMLYACTPIARFESQRTRGVQGPMPTFWGEI